ncbi:hypothetical protein H5410_025845 [Solanum commersonii]|uniref:F-box domain-containing protein n=1 Tax=Solanum commersonii TaxID=4109 RepID=A0A9J5YUV9_SOLCO|nr:hypothetical protein H5410_025845 [Solanum commersonii]
MAANTLSNSDKIFPEFPEDIIQKILSCVTLKQRPTVSLVSKKWRQIIESLDDNLNLVQIHSENITYGYCGYSHLYPHASCVCSDTDLYQVDPFIKLAADNISFKELYLFIPPNFSSAFTKIDLFTSTKLQLLHIDSTYVPDSFPHDVCSTFPSLKSLSLQLCRGMKKIKIVSPLLESLSLNNLIDLDEAFIATPNLQLFNVIYSFKFQTPCPIVGSRLMKVEMGARATNSLLELRTFAENLGENIMLSLETDTTGEKEEVTFQSNLEPLCIKHINLVIQSSLKPRYESFLAEFFGYFHPRTLVVTVNSDAQKHDFIQVLMNELEGWNKDGTKGYKRSEYMSWHSALKSFTVLGSTAFARQEREASCDKPTLCAGLGEGSSQKGLSVGLPNISTITSQEREAPYGKRPLCAGSGEGQEQQCILFVALPNLSTITREGAHQINLEFAW